MKKKKRVNKEIKVNRENTGTKKKKGNERCNYGDKRRKAKMIHEEDIKKN